MASTDDMRMISSLLAISARLGEPLRQWRSARSRRVVDELRLDPDPRSFDELYDH